MRANFLLDPSNIDLCLSAIGVWILFDGREWCYFLLVTY